MRLAVCVFRLLRCCRVCVILRFNQNAATSFVAAEAVQAYTAACLLDPAAVNTGWLVWSSSNAALR